MQLYAFDSKKQITNARQAIRQINYYCLECEHIVRLRGGPQRQPHFYHLDPTPFCRQHQKGAIHLQLQSHFFQQLPLGDCLLEHPFPSIGRIADVAWLSHQLIFEIQCSPISPEEILARNRDYRQVGWQVVWILHDQRYNQMRLSGAETALRASPHYFTNMNHLGVGIIYDQFDICEKGIRLKCLPPLPINIQEKKECVFKNAHSLPLNLLQQRMQAWNISFAGDLIDHFLTIPNSDYLSQAKELEKLLLPLPQASGWHHLLFKVWQKGFASPYQIFFRFLLERISR